LRTRGGVRRVGPLLGSLLLVLAVFLATAAGAAAAPANDEFAAPTPITVGSTTPATNVGATKEAGEPNHAGNAGGHSVWFSWTAPATETVGLSIPCNFFGPSLEALIAVYTGTAVNALTPVASNAGFPTGACSPLSELPEVELEAQAGVEYRIAVDGRNGSEGSFELKLAGAPANDDFAAATTIPAAAPQQVSGTTRLATKRPGEPDHAGDPGGHSIWFNWTPTTSGPVNISTCEPFGQVDALLAVYTGAAVNALTPVVSDDDALDWSPECRPSDSEVRLDAVAGTTYRIAVDATGGRVGYVNLRIKGAPANDSFASPQNLGTSHSNGTGVTSNKLATKEVGEPDHGGDPGGHSVWFSWTPAEPGPVTFSACPVFGDESELRTITAIYTGSSVGSLTEVAASVGESNLGCGGGGSEASFVAEAGVTYHVAVDGRGGTEGYFQLQILGPGANDSFGQAQALPSERSVSTWGNNRGYGTQPSEPDHAGVSAGHSSWFSWKAPSSGPVVISACQYGAYGGNPVLAVYTGAAVSALTPVAADSGGGSYCNPRASQVEFEAAAGTEYKIAIDATGAGGPFSLDIDGAPENDDFAAARVLGGEPTFVSGSTRFATKQSGEPNHAGDPGGHSVWFDWTPTVSGPITLVACPGRTGGPYRTPGGIDALLAVYTGGSLGGLTEVASDHGGRTVETFNCEMEGMDGASEVHFDAVAGTSYKIAVDGAGGGEGPFSLGFERGATNDDFAAAHLLEGPLPLYGVPDNRFATSQPGEPPHAGVAGGRSVWFDWTPVTSGPVWIATCTNSGSLDTLLGVYTGAAVDALTPVASNDDGPPREEHCRSTDSGVEVDAVAGTTYRIAVDGKGGSLGSTSLKIEGPPANDDFDRAASLGATRSNLFWGSNRFATAQAGEPQHGGVAAGHSIWFKWTAPRTGEFTFDTCGSSFDTVLAVYTGAAVNALTPVVGNDDAGGECSPASRVAFTATAGTVYRIAVDGKGGAVGAISLHLDNSPANDDFAVAEALPAETFYWPGSDALAGEESGEPGPGGHSVWYSWTPNVSGPVSLEACGIAFVPEVGLFTGTELAALTPVSTTAAGAGECDTGTAIEFTAVAGTTYRIAVGGAEGGRFELHLVAADSRLRLLTVRAGGAGDGSVSSSTAGIACGATCRYDLVPGTSLTLVAEPAPGSSFAGWSGGGCSGTGACTVTFQSDSTVTASFGAPSGSGTGGGAPTGGSGETPGGPGGGGSSGGSGGSGSTGTPAPKPLPAKPKPLRCPAGKKKVTVHGRQKCVKKAAPKKHKHPAKKKKTKKG
jgi:hypothetical protein